MSEDERPGADELSRLHLPVMRDRIVELLAPSLSHADALHVDVTLGMGGHALAVLEACPTARLLGIDQDADAIDVARRRLAVHADRVRLVRARFDELADVLDDLGLVTFDTLLADLGVSSLQIDRPERGFTYRVDAPLDMRMDDRQELTAADVVNTWAAGDLVRALRVHGDESQAPRIVRAIVDARAKRPLATSGELVELITNAMPAAVRHGAGGHPAKRTFQALRIVVNDELGALEALLPAALDRVALGGRLAVLAYHSGEDRVVKQAFRDATSDRAPAGLPIVPDALRAQFESVVKGAERPASSEVDANPRAASARLRVVVRTREGGR